MVRAEVLKRLFEGTGSGNFVFRPALVPGVFGDLLVSAILRLLPFTIAALLWMNWIFLCVPLSVLFYLEQRGEDRRIIFAFALISPILSANYFFLSGSIHFCLGVAFAFVTLGLWEVWLKNGGVALSWKFISFAIFFLSVVATYLVSLAAAFVLGILLVVFAFYRFLCQRIPFVTLLCSLVPHVALAIAYITEGFSASALGEWRRKEVAEKLITLASLFIRYDLVIDILISIFLALTLLLAVVLGTRSENPRRSISLLEFVLATTALFFTYLVLPSSLEGSAPADTLCLPFLLIFALSLVLSWVSPLALETLAVRMCCIMAALLNLVYLAVFLLPANRHVGAYVDAVLRIPEKKVVLPVLTRSATGRLDVNHRSAERYIVERDGTVPTFFDEDSLSARLDYLEGRRRYYTPPLRWYTAREAVDWRRVREEYDYILIEKPFEMERLRSIRVEPYYENNAAAVFLIKH